MDPAHYVGRACTSLRWKLDNVWPCHRNCHEKPDHLDKYRVGLIKIKGVAFVESLEFEGKKYCKAPNEQETDIILTSLRSELAKFSISPDGDKPEV